MTSALFVADGDAFVPTDLARGPWDPGALHGGPVSALLARTLEHCPTDGIDFEISRLTVELVRPVPPEPLAVAAEVMRPGRKVQLLEATLRHAVHGTELARARALRIRAVPVDLPVDAPIGLSPPPQPGPAGARAERSVLVDVYDAFHNRGSEHRFAAGTWAEPGPVTVWIRLVGPVVDDETPTPLQRVAAAADFGNGVSRVLDWDRYLFINPDLTIHLLRPAEGEWVALEASSHIGPDGIGMAESALYDERGRIGRAVQSLLVERGRPASAGA